MRRILPRVWSSRSMTSVAAFATFVSFVIETLCVRAQRERVGNSERIFYSAAREAFAADGGGGARTF
jgi:hypothetical protein